MDIISTSVLGSSLASVNGLVDLSVIKSPNNLLQVTGFADTGRGVVYRSLAAPVNQDGFFTVNFIGLPSANSFAFSVSLSTSILFSNKSSGTNTFKTNGCM